MSKRRLNKEKRDVGMLVHDIPSPRIFRRLLKEDSSNSSYNFPYYGYEVYDETDVCERGYGSDYDGGKEARNEEKEKRRYEKIQRNEKIQENIENIGENLLERLEYVLEGPACYDGECRQTFEISKPGWKKIPIGGINPNAGNGAKYHTGSWRIRKPIYRTSKCIQCFQCWISCPDVAIKVNEKRVQGIEYYHCKGCGICAQVCPTSAIILVDEDEDWGTETHTEVGPGEVIHKGHSEPER